jgi:hypothetical protein
MRGRGLDLQREQFGDVVYAASLLFLSAWARNEYLQRFGGAYVNSSNFRVIGQMFTGAPVHIAVAARLRAGETLTGGYRHGEVKFSIPPQVSLRDSARIDEALLKALDAAASAIASDVIDVLRTALSFVQLANSDDDFITPHAEAILMGSAFEQLLRGDGSKYTLGQNFDKVFGEFGGVTVADAKKNRPDIMIVADPLHPERALAQPGWWVHRKWIEELYDLRSKLVHKGTKDGRKWAWSTFENLLMAAHVFPLVVKLLLAREGHYALIDADRVGCRAVDEILASSQWADPDDGTESEESWSRILSKANTRVAIEQAIKKFKEAHPDFRWGDESG